jgi:hypothetical protein
MSLRGYATLSFRVAIVMVLHGLRLPSRACLKEAVDLCFVSFGTVPGSSCLCIWVIILAILHSDLRTVCSN